MEFKKMYAKGDKAIFIDMATGHFATNHSHINCYLDLTVMKSSHKMAKRAAALLAHQYQDTQIDTIACLEGTNMLGAFLASELSHSSYGSMNSGAEIYVLTPELNANNQMIFRENTQQFVGGKSVLLMLASVSTGKTIMRTLDCLRYYGARVAGVCAGFSAVSEFHGLPIRSVFTGKDFPDYHTYLPEECNMCDSGYKLDAIVNSMGFSTL